MAKLDQTAVQIILFQACFVKMTIEKLENDQPNVEPDSSSVGDVTKEGAASDKPSTNLSIGQDGEGGDNGQDKPLEKISAQTMTLDVAYQSLEMVRKVNLQVEFGEQVDDNQCVECLRLERDSANATNRMAKSKIGKWMISRAKKKATQACLTCGTPVCNTHRSSDFGRQNIAICLGCAHLFSASHIMSHIVQESDHALRKQKVNHMLEVYDRSLLVLTYSRQFIDDVVVALQGNTQRHNMVGLGSSATGVISGGLGVAAACTILTPVGPPLLLASILFGGGATAVNAGSEAVNYRCEPNKMADRILTLYSFITGIAKLPATMDLEGSAKTDTEDGDDDHRANKPDRGQSRLHLSRAAMHTLKPLTAGALSAVSIVTEAREMRNTVEKIRAGNPCEKSERLRKIKDEISNLPHTDGLSPTYNLLLDRYQQQLATKENEDVGMKEEGVNVQSTPVAE